MNIATLFAGVATVSWIAVFGWLVFMVVRASRNNPIKKGGMVLLVVIIGAALFSTVSAGLVFINPNERGVVISAITGTGYRETALEPGLRWVIPFAENVVTYSVAKESYTMSIATDEGNLQGDDSIEARTSDGQKVFVDASVVFSIDPQKVVPVHINWGTRYSEGLVRPFVRGIIRDMVAQYKVEEVYNTKRAELVEKINVQLTKKLADNGLVLSDFILRNITFSPEYSASIEQKQIAEQLAQQAFYVVEQRKQEAEQARQVAEGAADAMRIGAQGEADSRLIQAKAEAESLKLIAEVVKNNPNLLTYEYISTISPNIQVMLLPSNSPFLLNMPEMQGQTLLNGTSVETNP